MASIKLSQLYGNGQFKAEFFSGSLSHVLSSSAPLTITPPAGKVLRLDFLSAGVDITNTSISIGANLFVSNKLLSSGYTNADGSFIVSNGSTNSGAVANSSNAVQPILAFEAGQSITVSTLSASGSTIRYSYSYGE